jgi:hypothetical protein
MVWRSFMPDDGKGVKTIWRVENMDLVQVIIIIIIIIFIFPSILQQFKYDDEHRH